MLKHPKNESFLDTCVVYRTKGASSFSDEVEREILFEGKCDVQIPMTIRTFKANDVLLTDHAIYIKKKLMGVVSGDLIDVVLQSGVEINELAISEVYARDMGTMLIIRETKN